mmetsp:Transcript_77452/g.157663  ORF Transcript_77452/g.157663 Transcript_77452/m.157663 type:complete len:902 (+) Transcript_77452:52-2757(+)
MTSSLLRFLVVPASVAFSTRCDQCDEETTAQLQLRERRRSDGVLSKLQSRLTLLDNSLYWQGYGSESLASYFIGFLGHDAVQVGGLNITAKVGLNLMGNALSGNFYQSVEADAAVLGLLPGCFTGGCNPSYYDDLLSTMAREGKIRRAFTLCFDDSPRGGGKLFLGRPEIPSDAMKIPLHPLTDGLRPYSPLSTFGPSGAGVEFFFGSKRVGSRSAEEWNRLMRSGAGYSDTGTPGLVLPAALLDEVLMELKRKILADEMCASMWGPYFPKLFAQHLDKLTVTSGAASCALSHVEDFVVQLGPDISLNISKSSFFYETPPCSKKLKISWTSGNADTFIFGTALNWGKTLLYDTSDLENPKLILLGRADGCTANWAELATQSAPGQLLGLELPVSSPIELQGLPAQVLGRDGTMTATLMIGSPPQEMTMQLDTGSQKLVGVHENCRNLGFCFLVQPENVTNTALLPGPDYGTAKCQRQVEVLTQMLSNTSSCSHLKSKLLCECASQEECLRQILSAASQVHPSESCARDSRTCGEKMDFRPEASDSFRPLMAASRASGRSSTRSAAESARSFLGSGRLEQCQRYRFCHVDSPAGPVRVPESMAGLAPEPVGSVGQNASASASGDRPGDRDEALTVPPVPRDTFGEVDRATGSKQPKEAVEDASPSADVSWKSPGKPLQDSSERSREQTHRWEEVLKDSAQVAYKDQNYISSFEKAPEADQKQGTEVTPGSVVSPSSERSQREPTSKDYRPHTVYDGGTGSLAWPEAKEKLPGTETDMSPSSEEKSEWKPNVPDVLQTADADKRDSSVDAARKEKELGTLSPTSSDEKSQLEPTGGIASGEGPEPKDMAEKERSGTMSPISSKEDEKSPAPFAGSPISLAPVSDFMDGFPPEPAIGEPLPLRK